MPRYQKWLGAGIGWLITGNPLGGMLGFLAGGLFSDTETRTSENNISGVSELEANMMVVASHLLHVENSFTEARKAFILSFMDEHFDASYSAQRSNVFNHLLAKVYDLNLACDRLRIYTKLHTRIQVIRFLLDVANHQRSMTERENYFIFRVAGYMNVNDVEYKKLKAELSQISHSFFDVLEVAHSSSFEQVRSNYRRLVLRYHPDRNKNADEAERKKLSLKFQELQLAYEQARKHFNQ